MLQVSNIRAHKEAYILVSYTHLKLPTICSVYISVLYALQH